MNISIITVMILSATLSLASLQKSSAQGVKFENSWEAALQSARRENKMIFADFYASWCGPCVYMQKKVFPRQDVGDSFNQHYVSVSIDAENEAQALVEKTDLDAYPTMIFYSPDQEIIYRQVGAMSPIELVDLGEQVQKFYKLGKTPDLDKLSTSEMQDYLNILKNQQFAKARKIAMALLSKVEGAQLQQDFNLFLLTNFVHDFQNEHFQYLLQNMNIFVAQEEIITPYVTALADSLLNNAIALRRVGLVKGYAQLYTIYNNTFEAERKELDFYLLRGKSLYYLGIDQPSQGKDYYRQLVEKYLFENQESLLSALFTWIDMMDTEDEKRTALKWAQQAYKQEKNFYSSYLLAHILKDFDKATALIYAREALNLADNDDSKSWAHRQVDELTTQ